MSKITVTCNKCEASATVESLGAMNIWWDKHTCGETGGLTAPSCTSLHHD